MATRARPLPPDERRAAIVAATLPLLSVHGPTVTTRQIADAAGVAEGTIFGVFPDKEALIRASLGAAFDAAPVTRQLMALPDDVPLRETLMAAVEILQDRLATVFHLVSSLGLHRPRPDDAKSACPDPQVAIVDALRDVLSRHEATLRVSASESARLVHILAFAGSSPRVTDGSPLSPAEIVDLLMGGIVAPVAGAPIAAAAAC